MKVKEALLVHYHLIMTYQQFQECYFLSYVQNFKLNLAVNIVQV